VLVLLVSVSQMAPRRELPNQREVTGASNRKVSLRVYARAPPSCISIGMGLMTSHIAPRARSSRWGAFALRASQFATMGEYSFFLLPLVFLSLSLSLSLPIFVQQSIPHSLSLSTPRARVEWARAKHLVRRAPLVGLSAAISPSFAIASPV